jgi:dihydroorotate dehydrogenase
MYRTIFRPLLFRLKPERVHHLTIDMLRLAGAVPWVPALLKSFFAASHSGPSVHAFGLTFPNLVGLAAGYDKEGQALTGLTSLGFGHLEIGTITPRPQPGNPAPRIFRIPEEQAVINRMGFPNQGAEVVAARLTHKRPGFVLGINLGKNKTTPLEEAYLDYQSLIRTFAPLADYLAINISSPNTPNLRQLQSRMALQELLAEIAVQRQDLLPTLHKPLPILVKLSPDLTWPEIDDALQAIQDHGMDGVIATNTSTSRVGLKSRLGEEAGGLSGLPLRERSTEVIRYIYKATNGRLPIIGVGGIMTPRDAQEKSDAGACLIQLYTGMIFSGPRFVKEVLNSLT